MAASARSYRIPTPYKTRISLSIAARLPLSRLVLRSKILMKAMIKQIDRVINDLKGQAQHFRSRGGNPICVGVVGINRAPYCTTYEGIRSFRTDGKKYQHPIDEAASAEERLRQFAAPAYDEFFILRFEAINEPPYPFAWDNDNSTLLGLRRGLARISQQYENMSLKISER